MLRDTKCKAMTTRRLGFDSSRIIIPQTVLLTLTRKIDGEIILDSKNKISEM